MISFRAMHPDDLDQVVENEERSYEFPWTRGNFSDCLAAKHECRLLLLDAQVIGHGILSVGPQEAHLLNVCVRRDRQGHGYGRALVVHMLERAKARGAEMLFLEVRPSNLVAVSLYRSLGFNEIGLRRNYYPARSGHEDAQVMALDLGHYSAAAQV
ncbi:MAG TPA: ribosomal protein S18-alanine N-acetyltransferase [Pseudomonadales bacterium]